MSNQHKEAYRQKLLDPRWQKMRLQILERDEWTCQSCFDTETTLHVHHRWYRTGADPWDYPTGALVTLCVNCHEYETANFAANLQGLSGQLRCFFFASDVLCLSEAFSLLASNAVHSPDVMASAIAWAISSRERQKALINSYLAELGQSKTAKAGE